MEHYLTSHSSEIQITTVFTIKIYNYGTKEKSDEQDVLVVRDEEDGRDQRRRRTQQRRREARSAAKTENTPDFCILTATVTWWTVSLETSPPKRSQTDSDSTA